MRRTEASYDWSSLSSSSMKSGSSSSSLPGLSIDRNAFVSKKKKKQHTPRQQKQLHLESSQMSVLCVIFFFFSFFHPKPRVPVQPLQPVRQRSVGNGHVGPHPLSEHRQLRLLGRLEERNTRRGASTHWAHYFLTHNPPPPQNPF